MEGSQMKMREALASVTGVLEEILDAFERGEGGVPKFEVRDAVEEAKSALAAPVDSRDVLECPRGSNGEYIHVGDAVHMLKSGCDGDREWDDVVFSLEYVGEGQGGDDWLVYGEDGAAWACECEVLGRKEDGDGQ